MTEVDFFVVTMLDEQLILNSFSFVNDIIGEAFCVEYYYVLKLLYQVRSLSNLGHDHTKQFTIVFENRILVEPFECVRVRVLKWVYLRCFKLNGELESILKELQLNILADTF